MRPIVVFTGQGVARADGFNLTRRLKALHAFDDAFDAVPWRDRQNLDELLPAARAAGEDVLERVLQATRAMCLKERRTTARKSAHRAIFQALAAAARARLVVHLTANVDGLTSIFAARDFAATWPAYQAPASATEVSRAVFEVVRNGRGLVHLPVHGEAALLESAADDPLLRTFYGEPSLLRGSGPWIPTLASGLAADVRRIEEHLQVARLGYGLLRALVAGRSVALDGAELRPSLPPADLLAIGYGAGSRATRAAYPFERSVDELVEGGAPAAPQRFTTLLYDAPDSAASRRWYGDRRFHVVAYGDGELGDAVRRALAQPLPTARSETEPGERSGEGLKDPQAAPTAR